jgi:hypothetical protein
MNKSIVLCFSMTCLLQASLVLFGCFEHDKFIVLVPIGFLRVCIYYAFESSICEFIVNVL